MEDLTCGTAVCRTVAAMSDPHLSGRPAADPEPIDVTPEPVEEPLWQEDPAAEEAGPSRRRLIVLGSLLAVSLAGAAALGAAGWRIAQQKDTTLTTPTQVAGLVRDDSKRARTTADYLQTAFAADIDLDQSVGVVYSDPGNAGRSVLLFGGTTLLFQPERDLDSLFGLVSDDAGKVNGLHEVAAGDLGGVMKCGTTPSQDGDIAVCGWADHGSVVLAMFPGRNTDESAALLRTIREAVQTRD
jgi:hypothetical protein